jgi:hypothetical protein
LQLDSHESLERNPYADHVLRVLTSLTLTVATVEAINQLELSQPAQGASDSLHCKSLHLKPDWSERTALRRFTK